MHKDLQTDLPRYMMELKDFPFNDEQKDFMMATTYRDYLQSYADHFEITNLFRVNTTIISVKKSPESNKFEVISACSKNYDD